MAVPTYDDANVMLQLMRLFPVDESNWIWSDEFTPDYRDWASKQAGRDEARANVRGVLSWFESVGTLYKHGLLNEDLLFDWLAVDASWGRVKEYALAWREEWGNIHLFENFEAMAEAQLAWTAARDRAA